MPSHLTTTSPTRSTPPTRWLTDAEAAERARVSYNLIKRWRYSGLLPYSLIGRRILIDAEDLDRVITEHKVGGTGGDAS